MKNTSRHPAVIDLLGGPPLPTSTGTPTDVTSPQPDKASKPPHQKRSRSPRLRYLAALTVVVALLGWFLLHIVSGPVATVSTHLVEESGASNPTLRAAPPALAAEPTPETDPGACRTDPGDQKSGPGVIAAFEYAYYITRSGAAVRALTTPDTSLPPAETIQAGIDTVPTGTTHCVRITPITTDVYSVALAEMRPGQAPAQFPQTITTTNIDGRWFVDAIT
ncbi:hypothetical protein [Rhodococcus qingshengii]|uniref:hypothetical protein n=1 Tax=Rhodococcus qingshengii TaxID=334542 RepID=UPI001ADF398C|nr:hypothetical protein [Rhodococcus qingshengii]